jgi:hypothetical protein
VRLKMSYITDIHSLSKFTSNDITKRISSSSNKLVDDIKNLFKNDVGFKQNVTVDGNLTVNGATVSINTDSYSAEKLDLIGTNNAPILKIRELSEEGNIVEIYKDTDLVIVVDNLGKLTTSNIAVYGDLTAEGNINDVTSSELGHLKGINYNIQTQLDNKQDILTVGNGINIVDDTISVDESQLSISSKQDVLTAGSGINIVDDTIYVDESQLSISSKQDVLTAGSGINITDDTISVDESQLSISSKQDVLTAGSGINITDNTISVDESQLQDGKTIETIETFEIEKSLNINNANLRAHYKFKTEETKHIDSGGRGFHLIMNEYVTHKYETSVTKFLNKGYIGTQRNGTLRTPGKNDIHFLHQPTVFRDVTDFSISFWLKSDTAFGAGHNGIFRIYRGNTSFMRLRTNNSGGSLLVQYPGSNTSPYGYFWTSFPNWKEANTWYHIVVTFQKLSSGNVKIVVYLNNVASVATDDKVVWYDLDVDDYFSITPDESQHQNCKKDISDLRIYSSVLSPAEVSILYNLNSYTNNIILDNPDKLYVFDVKTPISVKMLVIGGGGGGGANGGGGGGGGEVMYYTNDSVAWKTGNQMTLNTGQYQIFIGRGGNGANSTSIEYGERGNDTIIKIKKDGEIFLIAGGGGGGASSFFTGNSSLLNSSSRGGGGGGGSMKSGNHNPGISQDTNGGNGGIGIPGWSGGGGSGVVNLIDNSGGSGANNAYGGYGINADIGGSYRPIGGGGGGAPSFYADRGSPGNHGGGEAASRYSTAALQGVDGSGGGGGGGGAWTNSSAYIGGNGGSGICIISWTNEELNNNFEKGGLTTALLNIDNWGVVSEETNLQFYYKNLLKSSIQSTDGQYINFTGKHSCKSYSLDLYDDDKIGYIVSSTGNYQSMNSIYHKSNIKQNIDKENWDALPIVELSTVKNDKRVFGVITGYEDVNQKRTQNNGYMINIYDKEIYDNRLHIAGIGEGGIYVSDFNGSLQNGDYITTSDIPGIGMKQNENFLCNQTVAKITMDCDFNPVKIPIKILESSNYEKITSNIEMIEIITPIYSSNYTRRYKNIYTSNIYDTNTSRYITLGSNILESEHLNIDINYDISYTSNRKIKLPIYSSDDIYSNLFPYELKESSNYDINVSNIVVDKTISYNYYHNNTIEEEYVIYTSNIVVETSNVKVYEKLYIIDYDEIEEPNIVLNKVNVENFYYTNLLDQNGEEVSDTAYEIKYIDLTGNTRTCNDYISDSNNDIYRMAFVGCTYHSS